MSANKDRLIQTRSNLIANLEKVTRNPKPSYSVDGQSYNWQEYQQFLMDQIAALKLLIDAEDDDDITEEHSTFVAG